jgi:hypothetical protein
MTFISVHLIHLDARNDACLVEELNKRCPVGVTGKQGLLEADSSTDVLIQT